MARFVTSTLLACLVLAGCGGGRFTPLHRQAMADSVRQFLNEYVEAVNRVDFAAIRTFYADAPGFHWADRGRLAYPSYQSLVSTFDSLTGVVTSIRLTVDVPRVVPLRPGLAMLTATYRQSLADTGRQQFRSAGAFSGVVEHRDDGWKFIAGHASTAEAQE